MSVGVWCSATISALWLYLEVNVLKGGSIVSKDRGIANPWARIGGGGGVWVLISHVHVEFKKCQCRMSLSLFYVSMTMMNLGNSQVVCHCRLLICVSYLHYEISMT